MSRRVYPSVRSFAPVVLSLLLIAAPAGAQTTLVLDAPENEVVDTTIRAGGYADTILEHEPLVTRASSNPEYLRRALLKFDTETRIPQGATIQSAYLTLTIKAANPETRTVTAYRSGSSWDEWAATWNTRKSGSYWPSSGGDLSGAYASATSPTTGGAKVTLNITSLVQEVVNGSYGSRYTRVALVDDGSSTNNSYREYYNSEADDTSVRPRLTVVYGSSSSIAQAPPVVPDAPPVVPDSADGATVVLDAPENEVVDTTIRAGGYADTILEHEPLVTRASSNPEYLRRALLKFDTETRIPQGATIQSAYLTLTIKAANPETRTVTAYRSGSSWDEWAATWNTRKSGSYWPSSGGDLSGAYASATSPTTAGAKVTLDITSLVQEVVNGSYGSRYTRVALVDDGSSTNNSYREYYNSEADDTSVRPRLTVVYGSSSSITETPTPPTPTPTPPTPTPPSSTSTTLKVLHWNTRHGGIGMDGRYDPDRLASWIAGMGPHLISLNEVDDEAKASGLVSLITSKTGVNWTYHYDGRGNLAMTRLPQTNESICVVNGNVGRKATHIGVVVNGRTINFWSAHFDDASGSARLSETYTLRECEQSWGEARIAAGDFNMQPWTAEYNSMAETHADAWLAATSLGTASNYSGNCDGCTRNSRIDYVFTSKDATFLTLKSAAVIDTRDANGYMASDHKPLLVTYTVR